MNINGIYWEWLIRCRGLPSVYIPISAWTEEIQQINHDNWPHGRYSKSGPPKYVYEAEMLTTMPSELVILFVNVLTWANKISESEF
jgi:hypothetical protein